ncbi:ribonuclease R [Natranaerobius thermophilus]|uniref:Ribonuclease R n=1 Tax=Natranaerobius thermophilus (strain ATCC BAA-1301 / DSM 18059 / JW/NM-WN-LF) TaxID=457570 RepID=B2A6Y6_NATTJ|nr:ribonuclease R [Natranaerobius thermophilus]ACB85577.1 ribonuclease R [Natranaerobius thermophilus JW/NM-WN-LF]
MILRDKIINFMKADAYKPMTFEELKDEFKINKPRQVKRFKKILKKMTRDGQIVKTRYGYYGLPERMNLQIGTIQGHPKGYAFLLPDKPGSPDVFLSPKSLNGALHNDKVLVRIHKEEMLNQKPEGEVVRIISRGMSEVVGTFDKSDRFGFVVPDDDRFFRDVFINKADANGAKNGQKVVAQITGWPDTPAKNPEGEIIKVIGNPSDPGVDIETIINKYGLSEDYPPKVKEQLEEVPNEISPKDYEGRELIQGLPTVTIDGSDAKDLDDAVSLEKLDNGNMELGVHIADVSYYVREGTPLDKEARQRGTSVYLVDRVLPMLPPKLSNNICSLNPGVERLTMSAFVELTEEGDIANYRLTPSVIKSNYRLTYEEVNELFDGSKEIEEKYPDVAWMLFEMKTISEKLRERRFDEGAIDFEFDEPVVVLDDQGKPESVEKRARGSAEKLIEEFMLLANRVVAEHHYNLDMPFIYRVHEQPDDEKVSTFREFASKFGYYLPKPEGEEIYPIEFQKVLEEAKDTREERAISTMMLRSMKQARYAAESLGHFGLSFQYYTHFTSPIRRYPDLVVHRIMREIITKKDLKEARQKKLQSKLEEIAYQSSLREQEATEAERESVDYKMAEYMEQFVGDDFPGIVSSVTSFGIFIELPNLVEGLVHVSSMTDDYYYFDEEKFALIGEQTRKTYRIGDEVKVKVVKTSKEDCQVDFELVED